MELMPIGGSPTTTEDEQAVPAAPAPVTALADMPAFVAVRARLEENAQKERRNVIASLSILAMALIIGLVVIMRLASDTRDKHLKLNQAHEARLAAKQAEEANKRARAEARNNAMREAYNRAVRQAHTAEIANAEARARDSKLLRKRRERSLARPQQRAYYAPPPPPTMPVVEAPTDPMQIAKNELEQNVLPKSGYGVGYQSITYENTASGYVAIVRFNDGNIATFRYMNPGWMVVMDKVNPALLAVEG